MAKMNPEMEKQMVSKFTDMTKNFKDQAEALLKQVNSSFSGNMASALKNYAEMQGSYGSAVSGINSGAKTAIQQILESFDKNYTELKKRIEDSYKETYAKANQAVDFSNKDFQTQCEECMKKVPTLPENNYKDVLKTVADHKAKLNEQLTAQYKTVIEKLDKNYEATKKELAFPDIKDPKLPALEQIPGISDATKNHAQQLLSNISSKFEAVQPMIENASKVSQQVTSTVASKTSKKS